MSLEGAVVLVTGATGNVGWGVAKAAAAAGATVVLPTRSARGRAELVADFAGERAWVVELDAGDEAAVGALCEQVASRFGRLDHVAAPLGAWWQKGASLSQPAGELRALLATYVEAPFVLARGAAPSLRASGGSFTLVTGAAGEHAIPGAGLLVAAVVGQYGLSRVLRAESAREPFRVNELRIACRIERAPRAGVVPSRVAGDAFVALMQGRERGLLLRYTGPGALEAMAE